MAKTATTTAIASSPGPSSIFGQTVTFSATVAATTTGAPIPTGTVQFSIDGAIYGTPLTLSAGSAAITDAALTVGSHTISGAYSGDSISAAGDNSAFPLVQTVAQSGTTTVVSSSADPSAFGQPVTLTVTVAGTTSGAGTPTGTVQFSIDGTPFGTAVTLTGGSAAITDAALVVGSHNVTASYGGATNFAAGSNTSSPLGQVVNKGATTTSLVSSASQTSYGQNLIFTATVGPLAPAAGSPTGAVYFYDGAAYLGQGTLAAGNGSSFQTSFAISSFYPGIHAITAAYQGDNAFAGSASAPVSQNITAPTLVNPGNQANAEGDALTLTISATNAGYNPLTFSAVGLPLGLSIDPASGIISGTIADGTALIGSYSVTVSGADGAYSASQSFTWTVAPRIALADPGAQTSYEGAPIHLTVSATDSAGSPIAFAASGLPGGLAIDSASGLISGVIATGAATQGAYVVTVSATEGSFSVSKQFIWTVNPRVALLNPGDQAGVEGDAVSLVLQASDSAGSSLSFSAAGLPTGLAIDPATGTFSGTIAAGDANGYPFAVTVTAAEGVFSASTSFTWTVNPRVTLTGLADQTSGEGATVNVTLAAADSAGNALTFSAAGLPAGLAIDGASGAITGTVAAGAGSAGPLTVTVSAADGPYTASGSFTWTVTPRVALTAPADQANGEGDAVNLAITATDSAGQALTFSAQGLAPGLSIDSASGDISGTIAAGSAASGPFTVTVTAAEGDFTATQSFSWTVNPRVTLPNPGNQANQEGDAISLTITAADSAGSAVTFSVNGLPPGLSANTGSGVISGTIAAGASAAGPYVVTVTATEGAFSAQQSFTWTISSGALFNPGDRESTEGDTVTLSLAGSGSAGMAYSVQGLPPGLTLDPSSGQIAGAIAPGAAQNTPYQVAISATDGTNTLNGSFSWTIDPLVTVSAPTGQTNQEGDNVSLQLTGASKAGNPLTFSAAGLPTGLSIDPDLGTISGTIAVGTAASGPYTVTVTATDGLFSATQSFTWTVAAAMLVNPGDQASVEGDTKSLALASPGFNTAGVSYSAAGLPAGLSIDASAGLVTGTIAAGTAPNGPYQVTVSASAGADPVVQSFTWTVTPRITLASPGDQNAEEGDTINLAAVVSDASGNAVTYSAYGLPSGLTIDPSTGTISGSINTGAAASVPYAVTLTATEGAFSASQSFNWTVTRAYLINPGAHTSVEGDAVSLSLAVSSSPGGSLNYFADGLPTGLTIDAFSGLITGTVAPGAAGDQPNQVTVFATNGATTASRSFAWTVAARVTVAAVDDQTGTEGDAVSLAVAAADAAGNALSFSAAGLPAGVSIDPVTGSITGTIAAGAAAAGPYIVTVTATEGSFSGSQDFTWTVNPRITLAAIGDQTSQEGDVVSLAVQAVDASGLTVAFSASGLPTGLVIDQTTGLISGTIAAGAASANPYSVIVTATEGVFSASQNLNWTVSAAGTSAPNGAPNSPASSPSSSPTAPVPPPTTAVPPPTTAAPATDPTQAIGFGTDASALPTGSAAAGNATTPSAPVETDTWHEHYTVNAEGPDAEFYLDVDLTGSSRPGPVAADGTRGANIITVTSVETLRFVVFGFVVTDLEDVSASVTASDILQVAAALPSRAAPDGFGWEYQDWNDSYTGDSSGSYQDANGTMYSFGSHAHTSDWWDQTDVQPAAPGGTVTEDKAWGGTWLNDVTYTDLNAPIAAPGSTSQSYPANMFAAAAPGTAYLKRSFDKGTYNGNSHATLSDGTTQTLTQHSSYSGSSAYRYYFSYTHSSTPPNSPAGVPADQLTWLIDYQAQGLYSGSEDTRQDNRTFLSPVDSETTVTFNSGQIMRNRYDFTQVYHRNDGTLQSDGTYQFNSNDNAAPTNYVNLQVHATKSTGTTNNYDTLTYLYWLDGASSRFVSDSSAFTLNVKKPDGSLLGSVTGTSSTASGTTGTGSSLLAGTKDNLEGTSSVNNTSSSSGSTWSMNAASAKGAAPDGSASSTSSSFFFSAGIYSGNATVQGNLDSSGAIVDGTSFVHSQHAGMGFSTGRSTTKATGTPTTTVNNTLNGTYSDSNTSDLTYTAGKADGSVLGNSGSAGTTENTTTLKGTQTLKDGKAWFNDTAHSKEVAKSSSWFCVFVVAGVPAGMSSSSTTDTTSKDYNMDQTKDRNPDVEHSHTWASGDSTQTTKDTIDAYLNNTAVSADRTLVITQQGWSYSRSTANGKLADKAGNTGNWNATVNPTVKAADGSLVSSTVDDQLTLTFHSAGAPSTTPPSINAPLPSSGWTETSRRFSVNEHSGSKTTFNENDDGLDQAAPTAGFRTNHRILKTEATTRTDTVKSGNPASYDFDIYRLSSSSSSDHEWGWWSDAHGAVGKFEIVISSRQKSLDAKKGYFANKQETRTWFHTLKSIDNFTSRDSTTWSPNTTNVSHTRIGYVYARDRQGKEDDWTGFDKEIGYNRFYGTTEVGGKIIPFGDPAKAPSPNIDHPVSGNARVAPFDPPTLLGNIGQDIAADWQRDPVVQWIATYGGNALRIVGGTLTVIQGIAFSLGTCGLGAIGGVGLIAVGLDQIITGIDNLNSGQNNMSIIELGGYSAAKGVGMSDTAAQVVGDLTPLILTLGFGAMGKACFTGETKILTRRGWVRMDELADTDKVASSDERDAQGVVEFKSIQEIFHFPSARIWHVHVKGQVIRATSDHPFYVWGKGWVPAKALLPGDRCRSHDGRMVTVDEVFDSGLDEPVYNCAVADYHTYFVGGEDWGFSVWAHNLGCGDHSKILRDQLTREGQVAAAGDKAAHLVPSTGWSNRSATVRAVVADSQRIVNEAAIGLDHAANGFFTASSRHLGTHSDAFQLFLNGRLSPLAGDRAGIITELRSIAGQLKSGALVF